jgi:hypothetical protein
MPLKQAGTANPRRDRAIDRQLARQHHKFEALAAEVAALKAARQTSRKPKSNDKPNGQATSNDHASIDYGDLVW